MTETITSLEAVLGSGAGGPLSAPDPWIQFPGYLFYAGGLVIGSPTGGSQGVGTINVPNYYINGVRVDLTKYLPYTGGTMTGMLALFADPVNNFDAVTKQYVDSRVTTINATFANYLPLAGGTITGALICNGNVTFGALTTLHADPTAALQAATKQYVDNKFSGIIAIPDAPSDGSTYGRNNGAWSNVFDMGTY